MFRLFCHSQLPAPTSLPDINYLALFNLLQACSTRRASSVLNFEREAREYVDQLYLQTVTKACRYLDLPKSPSTGRYSNVFVAGHGVGGLLMQTEQVTRTATGIIQLSSAKTFDGDLFNDIA